MASAATTAKGEAASRPAPVIFSPNFATSVSWMVFGVHGYFPTGRSEAPSRRAPARLPTV